MKVLRKRLGDDVSLSAWVAGYGSAGADLAVSN